MGLFSHANMPGRGDGTTNGFSLQIDFVFDFGGTTCGDLAGQGIDLSNRAGPARDDQRRLRGRGAVPRIWGAHCQIETRTEQAFEPADNLSYGCARARLLFGEFSELRD